MSLVKKALELPKNSELRKRIELFLAPKVEEKPKVQIFKGAKVILDKEYEATGFSLNKQLISSGTILAYYSNNNILVQDELHNSISVKKENIIGNL